MTSREKVYDIFTNRNSDKTAFWAGHINGATVTKYAAKWGIDERENAMHDYLGDDCRWVMADVGYRHPEGLPMFNTAYKTTRNTLSAAGCFADAETPADLDDYPWPDAKYCDFTGVYRLIDTYKDKMVFTGMWSCFYHLVADFFGMENYFIKMYECPEVVEALTERIVDFYVEANDKFFAGLGDRADVMFFGNDFGTQLDLFMSPEHFRKFVLPSFKRLIAVGKKYNKLIMLHSCGSIYRIIPDLIESGVDILHPIQAKATGMSADDLKQYKNDLAFLGGIDAQHVMPFCTPEEVEKEVMRVRSILGPGIVISPSHEEILPNVPAENMEALARAAKTPLR